MWGAAVSQHQTIPSALEVKMKRVAAVQLVLGAQTALGMEDGKLGGLRVNHPPTPSASTPGGWHLLSPASAQLDSAGRGQPTLTAEPATMVRDSPRSVPVPWDRPRPLGPALSLVLKVPTTCGLGCKRRERKEFNLNSPEFSLQNLSK